MGGASKGSPVSQKLEAGPARQLWRGAWGGLCRGGGIQLRTVERRELQHQEEIYLQAHQP